MHFILGHVPVVPRVREVDGQRREAHALLAVCCVAVPHVLLKKIEKAKWFKESMERREGTLKQVMEAIMSLQKDYFISGTESDLKPMKLADVADVVGMDISTISRVSNSKFIETHFGTFKIKELFSDAYRKDNGELVSTKEIKYSFRP